jgi:hypothetical protein
VKAISLWQPWATLVAIGEKQIETRHWCLPRSLVGQRIAIHAAKTLGPEGLTKFRERCHQYPFFDALKAHVPDDGSDDIGPRIFVDDLPRGAIVCTCVVRSAWEMGRNLSVQEILERSTSPREEHFGWYADGRWAWMLSDVEALETPVPCTGRQGFFEVKL